MVKQTIWQEVGFYKTARSIYPIMRSYDVFNVPKYKVTIEADNFTLEVGSDNLDALEDKLERLMKKEKLK